LLQKCADYRVSDKLHYPTLARTFPPATQVTQSVFALLAYHGWRRFSIVSGSSERWRSIADQVVMMAGHFNMTINGRFNFSEPYVPEVGVDPLPGIVDDSYTDTRGIVRMERHCQIDTNFNKTQS
jgi:hypothetical protein